MGAVLKSTLISTLVLLTAKCSSAKIICISPGIYPVADDAQKFTICAENENGERISRIMTCSNNTVFDPIEKRCVLKFDEDLLPLYKLVDTKVRETQPDEQVTVGCLEPGFICTQCKVLTACVGYQSSNGEINVSSLSDITCPDGQHCAQNIGCTSNISVPCSLGKFECPDLGMYPDPYDCKMYHICTPNNQIVDNVVPCKTYYDSSISSCNDSAKLCNHRPIQLCTTNMQIGVIEDNPNIYYICTFKAGQNDVLFPRLFKCPFNTKFNISSMICG